MLKTPEAAERIGVSVYTMKRWRRRTLEEHRQIGPKFQRTPHGLQHVVLYDEADVDQWIKDRMVIV